MEYKIESDVPVPVGNREMAKYPFSDMKIGDSFQFDKNDRNNVYQAARNWAQRYGGCKFKTRTRDDISRIWKLAL